MTRRAEASGIRLTHRDAAIAKGMLMRGDRQHDVAAWFGVNGGRIAEIATGSTFANVQAEARANLPPPGPYPSGREAYRAIEALERVKSFIDTAISEIRPH